MKLPKLENPELYQGLYIFDFGDSVAVGYTAAEVAVLLESENHRAGKVYRIHRAQPDGTLELQGVTADRFQLETGIFFCSAEPEPARADYAELLRLTQAHAFPCRAKLQRAELPGAMFPYCVALIYPAEYDPEVARWLLDRDYNGGQTVDAGVGHTSDYYGRAVVADRHQVVGSQDRATRTREEILASVRKPIQRIAV